MKRVMVILFLVFIPLTVSAEDFITQQFNASGLSEVYDIQSEIFPEFSAEALIKSLSSGRGVSVPAVLNRILDFLFGEFISAFKISAAVLAVGVIASVINTANDAFSSKGASQVGMAAVYCVFAGLLTAGFSGVITPAREMTDALCVMIKASLSVLISMCSLSGRVVSAGLMTGLLMSMINIVSGVMNNIVLPLALCSVSLSVAGNMSNKINISALTSSVRKLAKWVMLFCMAVYSGFFGLYGIAGASLDSAFGKAARFAIGSGIPIVGGVVAESVETVIATLDAVRGITGTAGIVVIVLTALSPILKTAAAMWMLRLCSAALQPIAAANITNLTSDVADSIGIVFAAMMCVCLLFAGSIGIITGLVA